MKRQDFRFSHRLRVRWAEVDVQNIVFNAHYLTYFDTASMEYWRAMALPYQETMHRLGGDLYLKKAAVEFHGSARMDDRLDVALKCERIGTSSMTFRGAIFRGDELLITSELIYVFADPASQTSKPMPLPLREALASYEAGETMVRVRTGGWTELGEHARQIRTEVFVGEQRIPADLEWDAADAAALHAVIYNRMDQAVAVGRLLRHAFGIAKIGRVAVHKALRGSGVGRRLMRVLMDLAASRGDNEVVLHAQRSVENFYIDLGFKPQGEPFEEAGIVHIEMTRSLIPA